MPIYTFDRDTPKQSTCNNACAEQWPHLLATPHVEPMGAWTMISLEDGAAQWAYKGKPPYTFPLMPPRSRKGLQGGIRHLLRVDK